MPEPRAAHAAARVGGSLFVVGGGGRRDRRAWALDLEADTWAPIADAPRPRDFPVAAAHEGRLYVLGGLHSPEPGVEQYPALIDCYDPLTRSWSVVGAMPRPRGRAGSVQVGHELWIVGGYLSGSGNVAFVDVLDLRDLTWREAPDLPAAVHGCAVAAHGGEILVLGNQRDGKRGWILRAATPDAERVWERLPDAPGPRLFAVGIHSPPRGAGPDGFIIIGDRSREPVPVLGYLRDGDGWSWRVAENAIVSTHRAPAVVVGSVVICVAGETVNGATARVQRVDLQKLRWAAEH